VLAATHCALDVARSNRSSEQAVVADAMETAGQHVQEKAADELGRVRPTSASLIAWWSKGDSNREPLSDVFVNVSPFEASRSLTGFGGASEALWG